MKLIPNWLLHLMVRSVYKIEAGKEFANSIHLVVYDDAGKMVCCFVSSTTDPRGDEFAMTSALEWRNAIKRGVAVTPEDTFRSTTVWLDKTQ